MRAHRQCNSYNYRKISRPPEGYKKYFEETRGSSNKGEHRKVILYMHRN